MTDQPPILAVDDDQLTLNLVESILRTEGYDMITAHSGRDALEVLHNEPIDLLITDLRMPGMDGFALLRSLAEIPRRITSIVLTGFAGVEEAVGATRLGAFDFLMKPISATWLRLAVARALEHHRLLVQNERLTRTPPKHPTYGNLIAVTDGETVEVITEEHDW